MIYLCLLFVMQIFSSSVANNATNSSNFIDQYISPSVRPYCTETHEKSSLHFRYGFRARIKKNPNSHFIYLFSEDKLFIFKQMTAALSWQNTSYVFHEIFFNEVEVKDVTDFWDEKRPNESINALFTYWLFRDQSYAYSTAFMLSGDRYRMMNLSLAEHKVTKVHDPVDFNNSIWGFTRNEKIRAKGFDNIFAVDMADSGGEFSPLRVYVKDPKRKGKAISFAFRNGSEDEVEEEHENGKHYDYGFDTAAYLAYARSMRDNEKDKDPLTKSANHYFELRTRSGTFSLFDFTYNQEFLLVGANEELLGCPPSFCHWREFDAIIRLQDGNQLLVYREWLWNFSRPGVLPVYEEAVIANITSRAHMTPNYGEPFKFGIREVVSGSFIDDSLLYIFRNGSFVSSKSDDIINNRTNATDFIRVNEYFKGVPFQAYDAILFHKESRTVHFIREDKYWAFSMSQKSLTTDPMGVHIQELGLPYELRVKSVYVEEDESGKQTKFYLFTKNRYLLFDASEFTSGRFRPKAHKYYCTSVNFFGCSEELYSCPVDDTLTDAPGTSNNLWIFIVIVAIVIIVLVAIIAFLLLVVLKKDGKPDDSKNNKHETKAKESKSKDNKKLATIEAKAKKSRDAETADSMASNVSETTQRSQFSH